ncbi:MAG: hypothetical protein KJ621_17290 [Proteobacteria bacterium]|nr:hypothetical protein [Pseudomonadota bacterium]MBU1742091.1 hypothetical protein [Pseudomonadota bacterium]
MKPLSHPQWEDLCRRCGGCCYEKIEHDDGFVEHTQTPCRYLDGRTNLCLVYQERFEVCPDCLPVRPETVAELNWLPEDCGYVAHLRRVRAADAGPTTDLAGQGRQGRVQRVSVLGGKR